jgi:hypothetical protein
VPAMTAGLVIGGVALLAMIAVARYGSVALPPDARIPVHWGGSYGNFVSKRTGLITWPAVAALIYGMLAFAGQLKPSHGNKSGDIIAYIALPVVMCILLAAQAGAIMTARRRSGDVR